MSTVKMAASSSDSEESLASLCKEAEQLKVKIDEEKQKFCDLQRKFYSSTDKASLNHCARLNPLNPVNSSKIISAVKTCLFQSRKWETSVHRQFLFLHVDLHSLKYLKICTDSYYN